MTDYVQYPPSDGPPPQPEPEQHHHYYYYRAVNPRPVSGFAIASMVLGILWLYWVGSVLALTFGYIALRRIDEQESGEAGRGMAIAGITLGWIGVGLGMLLLLALMIGTLLGA